MKVGIWFVSVAATLVAQGTIAATPPTPAKTPSQSLPSSTCSSLKEDYDNLSKDLAELSAKSIGDNSAPREQIRQQQRGNDFAKASVLLSLMAASKCAIPSYAPDEIYFMTAATKCQTADLDLQVALMNKTNVEDAKAKTMSACTWSTWEQGPKSMP